MTVIYLLKFPKEKSFKFNKTCQVQDSSRLISVVNLSLFNIVSTLCSQLTKLNFESENLSRLVCLSNEET